MEQFISPLVGGVLIGLAASLLLFFNGRIFGISGMLYGVLSRAGQDFGWRVFVLIGLATGSFILHFFAPEYFDYSVKGHPAKFAIAGLLVGFGTRLGSGCTSGHGVCGMSNLSIRSIVATLTFMLAGIITVYIMGGL